ncbi:MAG: hypothetical protein U1F43_08490 [Myxococcota bacterium]
MLKSLVVVLALLWTAPALAEGQAVRVEVTVIHATNAGTGVAPDLAGLAKYLTKSFTQYNTFQRLDQQQQDLAQGAEAHLALANGSELVYRNGGLKDGFVSLHLEVGGLKTTVNVKDGGTFFQAGRAYNGGMIVLAFKVTSH